jgi:FAD-linked oxidoreductase
MATRRQLLAGGAGLALAGAGGAVGYRLWRDREPDAPPAQDAQGRLLWRNWSGIQSCYPAARAAPGSEDELSHLLKTAEAPVRIVGAGHSFMPLIPTTGTLVSLDRLSGLVAHDPQALTATVRAGTRLGDLGPLLAAIGQEMPNLPDINKQSLGGAFGTGTHGTGKGLRAIHAEAESFRLVTASGEILDCNAQKNPEIFNAAKVGVGAFGVIVEATMRNRPLVRLEKRVALRDWRETAADWEHLKASNRNVEFYVLPFTGKAAIITANPTTRPVLPRGADEDTSTLMSLKMLRDVFGLVPPLRRAVAQAALNGLPPEEMVDEGWKLLSNERPVRFNEMEFHLPAEAQIAALTEVVEAIEAKRSDVFFPIEVRTIEEDDAWLSPFYGRKSGSIAVHAYYKDDYSFLFQIVEPILRRHGGRPHWGKLNSLTARDFSALYPKWKEAMEVRRTLDPGGRLLNPYLRKAMIDG